MSKRKGLPPGIDRWPSGPSTLGRALAAGAARLPDKIAVAQAGTEITYGELDRQANQLAHWLLARGLGPGDHVAILAGNCIEHVVALFAAARIGAVSVVMDVKWVARELSQALAFFDCDFLLYDGRHAASVAPEVVAALPRGAARFDGSSPAGRDFTDLFAGLPSSEPDVEVRDSDVLMLMLTSGTTGMPKGCIKTHASYMHSCAVTSIGRRIHEGSRELIVVPIYYNSGRVSLLSQLVFGGTLYLRERFDPQDVLETIERDKITCLALAPAQCIDLLDFPGFDSYDKSSLESLRKVGLPFQTRMVKDIVERLCPNLYQSYGGTEFSQGTMLYPEEQLSRIGSSGRAMWNTEVGIVDAERRPLPAGERGEVRVRGPSVCQGYYNNEESNRTAFLDGWYYSGDLGYMDDEGYLYIVGRKKDVIKTGGINVAPREIEDVILTLPEIADVAVISVPDARWGEMIKALVVAKPGQQISAERILERCGESLARYKIPKEIEFRDHIPRNPLGKVTADFKAAQHEPVTPPGNRG